MEEFFPVTYLLKAAMFLVCLGLTRAFWESRAISSSPSFSANRLHRPLVEVEIVETLYSSGET